MWTKFCGDVEGTDQGARGHSDTHMSLVTLYTDGGVERVRQGQEFEPIHTPHKFTIL